MDEYLCLTLLGNAGESEPAFKSRLTAFWTLLLRGNPDVYDAVFAEARAFGFEAGRVSRAYMVKASAARAVCEAARAAGIDAQEPDETDVYTKYEASGSDWFQLAH
jgi:hypothetical protein